jgi:hypothetical protein
MPVRKLVKVGQLRVQEARIRDLVDRLAAEWTAERPGDGEAPAITEMRDPNSGVVHVYVAWAAFHGIGHQQRSEIIMDAYERVAPNDIPNVTLAMGLLPSEAERMGLDVPR